MSMSHVRLLLFTALFFGVLATPAACAEIFLEQQFLYPGSPGMVTSLGGHWYGNALAAGDFNGDGYVDMAVGAPKYAVDGQDWAGAVHVLYAHDDGLSVINDELWSRNSPGVPGAAQEEEEFGRRLAAGDFNGDGYADLAVGAPKKYLGDLYNAGEVVVLYGSPTGLSSTVVQAWNQDTGTIVGAAEVQEQFGDALATGDFNGDGYADLAVGIERDEIGGHTGAGSVNIIFGSASGLTDAGNQNLNRDLVNVPGEAATLDNFGAALAAGDFDGDGYDDLAVGVPLDDEFAHNGGSVDVFYGNASGLATIGTQRWSQNSPSVTDVVEAGDRFGESLVSGDFNGDGFADLVVGVPYEDSEMGAVHVLYGTSTGLSASPSQYWTQDWMFGQTRETGDRFGWTLTAGDFDGDGFEDLVIAAPWEDAAFGMAGLLRGTSSVLIPSGTHPVWTQGSSILDDVPEFDDKFGLAMAAGDIDGDGIDDLAIAAPTEDIENGSTTANAGAFHVLLSGLSRLVYPHVDTRGSWATEVCAVNDSGSAVSGTFTAFDAAGKRVAPPHAVSLAAHGRTALNVASTFSGSPTIKYITFVHDGGDGVVGYTKFTTPGRYRAALPASAAPAAGNLHISHVASDPTWWTGIGLVNLTGLTKSLTLRFNTGATRTVTLPPYGQTAFLVRDLIGGWAAQPSLASAVLEEAAGVVGLELFGQVNQLGGIRLTEATSTTLFFPHIHSDAEWWTGLAAYNPHAIATTLTITPYSADGGALTGQSIPVSAKGKYVGLVQNLSLPAGTAWIKVTATQPVTGFELFGTNDEKLLAGFTAVNLPRTSGVFPKIEPAGWTGIALVNTTASALTVTLTAYRNNGTAVATAAVPLAGYAKTLGYMEDLFSGSNISTATYITFSATGPVAGFQLNGSDDGWLLDGLPGM